MSRRQFAATHVALLLFTIVAALGAYADWATGGAGLPTSSSSVVPSRCVASPQRCWLSEDASDRKDLLDAPSTHLLDVRSSPKAFPEAEGGGAGSVGGRGGAVYEVENLNDSGTGSLRACVEATGARTCVFRVHGTIKLSSPLTVSNPFLTVAGQTSPGGILISGKRLTTDVVRINTHDVIWRYTRIQKGYNARTPRGSGTCVQLLSGYNVILDHNSILWGQDGPLDATTGHSATTVSYNIIAEPLNNHLLIALSGNNSASSAVTNSDYHHNYLANARSRFPYLRIGKARLYNNLIYNWKSQATTTVGGGNYDFVSNYYKRGPLSPRPGATRGVYEVNVNLTNEGLGPTGDPSFYATGNEGPNVDPGTDNWPMFRVLDPSNNSERRALPPRYRRATPLASWGVDITAEPAASLPTTTLPIVGASRYLNCSGEWVMARDAADARIISNWSDGGGTMPTDEAEVGGMPNMSGVIACMDTDHDGMPDAWETAQGLDRSDASDRNDVALGSAYTNLERYLNGPDAGVPLLPARKTRR